jgi:hypothetical protein
MIDYLFYIVMIIYGLVILSVGFFWFCINTLKVYPQAKLSKWIRRHIITDEDLDPPPSKG